ncbi:unnamed protein product [Pleuronectes platessa]|uniref:Uncharacterized protein n=1 Tax=Pleuronectes platessa TaxID=8262 RepID=A0A9N7YNZ8_PLEPL|nr:unnamed protein product [Pleuronectes platessa]
MAHKVRDVQHAASCTGACTRDVHEAPGTGLVHEPPSARIDFCHLMPVTRRRSGLMAGSDRCLCGLDVPAPHSGSVAEEKGGGPGADSVSADSAEGHSGEMCLLRRSERRTERFAGKAPATGGAILIASWPPVVENGSVGGVLGSFLTPPSTRCLSPRLHRCTQPPLYSTSSDLDKTSKV